MSNDRKKRAERAEQMRREREKAAKRQRNIITIAIVGVVVVLIGAAAYGVSTISKGNAPEAWSVTYGPEDAGATPIDNYEPVLLELYEDFQCPGCASLEAAYGEDFKALVAAGDIEIKYYPYSFLDDRGGSTNDYSKRAHNTAICVYEEYGSQAFVDFHDYLYANQPTEGTAGPEDDELIAAADSMGFTGLADCVNDETYFKRIDRAREAGGERGVTGTPTVYLEGEVIEDRSTLLEQINAAVAEKKGEPAPATTEPAPAETTAPAAE